MQSKLSSKMRPLFWGAGAILGLSALLMLGKGLSQAQYEDGISKLTLKDLTAAHAQTPEDNGITFEMAHRLQQTNQNEQAFQLMQTLVRKDPHKLTYWQGMARCAADAGHAVEALEAYRKASAMKPDWADGHFKIAEILNAAGLKEETLKEYQQGAALDPASTANTEPWAECLMATGHDQEAWDRLSGMSKKTMLSDHAYEMLAELGIRLKRTSEAYDILEGRIKRTSLYPSGPFRLGQLRMLLAQHPGSEELNGMEQVAQSMIDEAKNVVDFNAVQTARYYALLGRIRLANAHLPTAQKALEEGLKLDPKCQECMEVLVDVHHRSGNKTQEAIARDRLLKLKGETQALADLRQAVQAAPKDTALRLKLAEGLGKAEKFAEATDICDAVLAADPQEATARALRDPMRQKALEQLDAKSRKAAANGPHIPTVLR